MGPFLILFVQSSLLHDHLFKEISLSFEDKDLAETLLMLLNAKPVIMTDLDFGNFLLFMTMHVQHWLVDVTHLRLIVNFITFKVNLMLSIISIKVRLSSFVEALQQLFIDQILSFLIIEILIFIVVVIFWVTSTSIRRLLICEIRIVLVSFLEFALLLKVDDFRIVDTNGAL